MPSDQNLPAEASATNLPAQTAATMLRVISDAAANPAVDTGKMQQLLDMQMQLMRLQAEQEFDAALARLQPRLPRITKRGEVRYPVNKNNPEGPSRHAFRYARWEDIDDAIRPLLNEEGFSLSADTIPQPDGRIIVVTTLQHRGGHKRTAQIGPLPLDTSGGKNNVQAVGSTFSYGKRYGATALLNLVFEGEDDDGVAGGEEFIDAESVRTLDQLIRETRSDFNRYCDALGVGGLTEIRVKDYPAAVNLLMDKKRKMQAAG